MKILRTLVNNSMATTLSEEKKGVAPSEKTPETVTVPKSSMDEVLAKLDAQEKQIKMLTEISDKSRKFNWDQKNQDFSNKIVRLSWYKDQMVVAWRTVKDEVFQDGRGVWHENQVMEIILADNTRLEINYLDFVKFISKKEAPVISRFTTPEGKAVMRVDVDGKQVDIDETFVN